LLFLSYAEEDQPTAREIATWLRAHDHEYYDWQERRGGRFIEDIENTINEATAFVALMSPHFLASPWCRMEREFAIQHELDLRSDHPGYKFIYVLKIRDTPYAQSGFLRSYDWFDLTGQESMAQTLEALVDTLRRGMAAGSAGSGQADRTTSPRRSGAALFRNRREELDRVVNGLTNTSGPHFWLVVAPPQLGKTWLLDRLSAEMGEADRESPGWATRLVDLHDQPAELHSDADGLLSLLFGSLTRSQQATPRTIARGISRSKRPYLCLLDGAELLAEETAVALRERLGDIYRYVRSAGNPDVRLAVVVASRRAKEWRGVAPDPRLTILTLTEFTSEIVVQALRDLAAEMDRKFSPGYFERNGRLIHRLGEGLPAMLVPCLRWVREQEWIDLEPLESPELFIRIAEPYIQERLLSYDSLYPQTSELPRRRWRGDPGRLLDALAEAFRLLVPYRLFTQSHLRHRVLSDRAFAEALDGLGWKVEDMWDAISRAALLKRPLDEPWQEIHPAIRRLLYRYFYQSDESRIQAHDEARKFVEVWATQQAGKEQVIGVVESLWHEAVGLRLSRPGETEERLLDSARNLARDLIPSEAYTVSELQDFAVSQLLSDEEFRQAVDNVPRLFDRIVAIYREPRVGQ
jgi:hypothetical protein